MVHGSVDLPSALSPLLDVGMLVGVVHMKPFLTLMTWPLTMNAPSAHVLAMLCVLGQLCRSVIGCALANFLTCMVHGSVDLPSAFVHVQCCVCVVLFSVTAGSQAVLWHCIDCSANSLPVC